MTNVFNHELTRINTKFSDCLQQIISHAGKLVCVHEIKSPPEINADNDEFRVMPIASAFTINRDDLLIIIDRAFRPKATDHSESFHLLTANRHK